MSDNVIASDAKPTSEEKWGFELNELYKLARKFYRENENKAFHLTYDERNLFHAYSLQIAHGPFNVEHASPLGHFDIIGRDRRQSWADLKDICKEDAMCKFIELLDEKCPCFKPYIEAHKRDEDERRRLKLEDELRLQKIEQERQLKAKQEEEEERKMLAIKEALNQQTLEQFTAYALQQYPNDADEQRSLIKRLQEQHYQQYMQQMIQYQINATTTTTTVHHTPTPLTSTSSTLLTQPQFNSINNNNNSLTSKSSSNSKPTRTHHTNHHEMKNRTSIESNVRISNTSNGPTSPLLSKANNSETKLEPNYKSTSNTMNALQMNMNNLIVKDGDAEKNALTAKNEHGGGGGDDEDKNDVKENNENSEEEEEEDDDDDEDDSDGEECGTIESAQMWTRKEIKLFKELISKDSSDGIIKVGHGEIVTVRVPTHPDGKCIYWEFATDSYDIGFGVLFEWTKNPGNQVSVHISESEDDDDDEDDDDEENMATAKTSSDRGASAIATNNVSLIGGDIEKGRKTSKSISSQSAPCSVIIPIYRRNSHEEVFAGSHVYPGVGVYLLKFDNSYSLWRSKTLYYRIYYTQ